MKYYYLLLIPVFLLCCKNSKKGSGNIIKQTREISSIDAIKVSGPIKVDIETGAVPKLVVETDDNILDNIETKITNNSLKINLKGINNLRNSTIYVHVVLPVIKNITTSAAATVRSNQLIAVNEKMIFKASSASKINLSINAPELNIEASSAAVITLEGTTKNIKAEASSASNVNLYLLKAETASASVSSGAEISLFASLSITASASSGGSIKYKGGATSIKNNISSGGSVRAY